MYDIKVFNGLKVFDGLQQSLKIRKAHGQEHGYEKKTSKVIFALSV